MNSKIITILLLLFLLGNFLLSGMEYSLNTVPPDNKKLLSNVIVPSINKIVYTETQKIKLKNTTKNKPIITKIKSLFNNKIITNNKNETLYKVSFCWTNSYDPYSEPSHYHNTCTIEIRQKDVACLQCTITTECKESKKVTTYPNMNKNIQFRFYIDWKNMFKLTITKNPDLPKIFKKLLRLISKNKT